MDYYGLVLSNWSKFRNLQTPREETRRPPVFYWSYVYIIYHIYTHTELQQISTWENKGAHVLELRRLLHL